MKTFNFFTSILLLCQACAGKVINTDASASYLKKVSAGVAQGGQWLSETILNTGRSSRAPRDVQLALVGLGRTGTSSFAAALKILGYSPVHDNERWGVSSIFKAMMDGDMSIEEVNIELGRKGFDSPWVVSPDYVKWAAKKHNVKVITTVREKEKWAKSWLKITPAAYLADMRPFRWITSFTDIAPYFRECFYHIATNGNPGQFQNADTLEAGFEAWNEFVRETVPSNRLLEFDVRQGWDPLCKFLDKPIPAEPFPHINDSTVIDSLIKFFIFIAWVWPLLAVSPFLLSYYLVARKAGGKEGPRGAAEKCVDYWINAIGKMKSH